MAIQTALEKEVIAALQARGRSENEARVLVEKLKKSASSPFVGDKDMELSTDGKYLAINKATCMALSRSGKAILVEFGGVEMWFPVNQIVKNLSEVDSQGDVGIFVITRWIASKKGLVDHNGNIVPPKAQP